VSPRARRAVDSLLDSLSRLTLVAGKGGVGKTTCAAALALRATERGGRVLLLSTDPAGTLGEALGVQLGSDPAAVAISAARAGSRAGSLDAFQLDAAAERRRFLDRWRDTIITIIDRGTYLDRDDVTGLVDAALPGADEVFAVLRLGELERASAYDRIIVDTAPTGHTLRLLDVPRTFAATIELLEAMQAKHRFMVRTLTRAYRTDAADALLAELRAHTATLMQALRDPSRTAAILVTRSEPLVVAETDRYAAELAKAGIRIAALVRNAPDDQSPAPPLSAGLSHVPPFEVPLLRESPVGQPGLRRWAASLDNGSVAREARATGKASRRTRSPVARQPGDIATRLSRPLTIVGGKGGVGKTTSACALAIAAADVATPVLVVSTDPAPSVADALGIPVGDSDTPVPGVPGLSARQMDATAAFRDFQHNYQQRVDAIFDAFVQRGVDTSHDRAILRDLLNLSPPGIDELYALASLGETLDEGRFARVIVDPAPTGHLLRLLQMPALALEWSHRLMRLMLKYRDLGGLSDSAAELLAFARRTRRVGELLRDPDQAIMVVVALDEPLVRGETIRLVEAARGEGMPVGAVVWNRWQGRRSPDPLSVMPPDAQFVAPMATPPPVGASALRVWANQWREATEADD
jgi:arsenite-transporting ATPase